MSATTSNLKGIERGRAEKAYEYATQAFKTQEKEKIELKEVEVYFKSENYKSYAKKLPMMIKNNGLGAALAFIFSKGSKRDKTGNEAGTQKNPKNAYDLLYHQLGEWLMEKCVTTNFLFENKNIELVEAVIKLPSDEYRAVTLETLALMAWVSRFAEGLIQGEINQND